MALDSSQFLVQTRTFVHGLTLRQKVMIALSLVLVAGVLWLFVSLIGQGEYKTLYSGLSPDEAQSLVRRLQAENIPARLSADNSTLSVPANEVDKARLEMAAKGLPVTGRQGFEIFDKPNWAGSDFVEQVNYQRALEGELERTIESMNGVDAVRVHLVLPHESLFTERERPAKAAVLVKLEPGARLSDNDLSAIQYLVASSVDNLKPDDVTVVDAEGRVPLLAHHQQGSQAAQDLEKALTQKVLATLTPVVGTDDVRAAVTVEYELGSTDNTQETYDPNNSVVLTSQTSDQTSNTGTPQGVPGATSNVPQNQQAAASAGTAEGVPQSETSKTDNKTYGVGHTVKRVVEPPGSIKRISAAVLVNDAIEPAAQNAQGAPARRKRTPDEMKQIQALAAAAIGIDPARGDKLDVEDISFSLLPTENLRPRSFVDRIAPMVGQFAPELKYVALLLLFLLAYVLILRPVKKTVVASFNAIPQRLQPAAAGSAALGAGAASQAAGAAEVPGALPRGPLVPELTEGSPEARQAAALRDSIAQKVAKEPHEVGRLVQDWVRQR